MNFKSLTNKFLLGLLFSGMISLLMLLNGCNGHQGSESQLKESADSFSNAYFNWQFKRAVPYVSNSSVVWLRYAASQVHQEDVDSLRKKAQGASCKINDVNFNDDDVTATVLVTVKNYLRMDTIGNVASNIDKAVFKLDMKYENNQWKVKMAGLPRSEKQNHD